MDGQCKNCRYWTPLPNRSDAGQCRRFPPSNMLMAQGLQRQAAPMFIFPAMLGTEFCGEYAPLKPKLAS